MHSKIFIHLKSIRVFQDAFPFYCQLTIHHSEIAGAGQQVKCRRSAGYLVRLVSYTGSTATAGKLYSKLCYWKFLNQSYHLEFVKLFFHRIFVEAESVLCSCYCEIIVMMQLLCNNCMDTLAATQRTGLSCAP